MEWLNVINTVVGAISLLLAIITLSITVGIKKSVKLYVEKDTYHQKIDDQIRELKSYLDTINKDPILYNDLLLDKIMMQLDEILINYEVLLPKQSRNNIDKLLKHIKNKCRGNLTNIQYQRECKKQLNAICIRLGKDKKILCQ